MSLDNQTSTLYSAGLIRRTKGRDSDDSGGTVGQALAHYSVRTCSGSLTPLAGHGRGSAVLLK